MTKTDFAELKEKLTKIDYVDANAYLTRYMEGGYEEPTYQQYGDYIHGKSTAIISDLIEIIQSQSECIEFLNKRVGSCAYSQIDKFGNVLESVYRSTNNSLSETTTRLQKLREGK